MGRFVHPGSVRYGSLLDWTRVGESFAGVLKVKAFIDYLEKLIKNLLTIEESIIINSLKIDKIDSNIVISIELYDRLLELSFREAGEDKSKELILENLLGDKLLLIKRLVVSEGYKYFKTGVKVNFLFVSMKNLNSKGLSEYISYNLEKGYNLVEILRLISREFKAGVHESDNTESMVSVDSLGLTHRNRIVYSEDVRMFKKILISGRYLLGFRVDISGRFSRKQRASKKSVCEGTVPLGSFKGYMDYHMSKAIMDYGVSSVRVWLYFDRDVVETTYLCEIR